MTDTEMSNEMLLCLISAHWHAYLTEENGVRCDKHGERYKELCAEALRRMKPYEPTTKEDV